MALFVIGDLHLSFGSDKPMDVFGEAWKEHYKKIETDWKAKVSESDTVIIPGDISWAMSFEDAMIDLKWIESLPGRKILFKGNHDYWWTSLKKMSGIFETLTFVHNGYAVYGELALIGTRGWLCPNEVKFDENDEKVYKREIIRLENSILSARKDGYTKLYGVMHYPPTNDKHDPSGFTEVFERYGVEEVVYGHLHAKSNFKYGIEGTYNGVKYHLTSCDYLDFNLFHWI